MHPAPFRKLRHRRRASFAAAFVIMGAAFGVGVANAAQVTPTGPLTVVDISETLNCQVQHEADTVRSFYGVGPAGCGTFVADAEGVVRGPDSVAAGPDLGGWTTTSQVTTGAGTSANPYKIVTEVEGGPFKIVQTDTYRVGDEFYRTDIALTSATAQTVTVYRAGDCYLQDDDRGTGVLDAGIAPTCKAHDDAADPDRIMQFYPLTSGSRYLVDYYGTVWDAVESAEPLPNTINGGDRYDNAMALSWTVPFAAGQTRVFSSLLTLSPTGVRPLTVTKTVDRPTVDAGDTVTYTIDIANAGTAAANLTSIVDELPPGFTYVPGSTTGATTADPSLSGSTLTWAVSATVPAATGSTPGTQSISFDVIVSDTAGTYVNTATAVATDASVIGANGVAPVQVVGSATTTTTGDTTTTTTGDTTTTSMGDTTTTTSPPTTTTTAPPTTTTSAPTTTAIQPPTTTPPRSQVPKPPASRQPNSPAAPGVRPLSGQPRYTG